MTIYTGKVRGDLTLRKGDDASKVTEVTGGLYISAEGAQLPMLTSVGGGLDISAEGAQLPVLTSVGGWLYISAGKRFHAPLLREVAGKPLPDPEVAAALLLEVAKAATASPDALDMGRWHCGTSHCIAGWAVHLAAGGYELEAEMAKKVGEDRKTLAAGNLLLGAEASSLFFLSNDAGRSALHRVLEGKPALEPAQ